METGDNDLARAAAQGDGEAFAALLSRHYDGLFRLCFRLTGRREWAEDLTQDICLALPAKLKSYRGQAKFATWLYRVAINAAHDMRRRHASRSKAAHGWGDWEINRRAADDDRAEGVDWLTQAMQGLPQELRDTAALTLGDDMTHAQAAAALGVSEGTISWRLSEIRKRLKALRDEELRV
ncbi:MAG: RNA polymerase sigma factor [Pseudomonadota bacterium]